MNKKDWVDIEKKLLEAININKKNKVAAEDGIEEGNLILAAVQEKIKTFK